MNQAPKEKEKKVVHGMLLSGEIVAGGGRYYRNARFIIVLMFVGFGILCIRDGFYTYPRENAEQERKYFDKAAVELGRPPNEAEKKAIRDGTRLPHTDVDIILNQILAVLLPLASIVVLSWTLYKSRGEYRLSENTLHIPGHPPIPLDAIHRIDKTRWDRKGIAFIEYELSDGKAGIAKMDDFVYAQDPTDAIMDRIEAYVADRSGDGVHEVTNAPTES